KVEDQEEKDVKPGAAKVEDKDKDVKPDPAKIEKQKEKDVKPDAGVKKVIDKELLKAYRYFDRNIAGYIKAEDLRMLIHNLGKFYSHRNVK
ncbi:hypothetical protein KI387_043322, partial [Taxus chinensis]